MCSTGSSVSVPSTDNGERVLRSRTRKMSKSTIGEDANFPKPADTNQRGTSVSKHLKNRKQTLAPKKEIGNSEAAVGFGQRRRVPASSRSDAAVTATPHCPSVLSPSALRDIFKRVDPLAQPGPDVEKLLVEYSDNFVEKVIEGACLMAVNRNSKTVEVDDVALILASQFNISVPSKKVTAGKDNNEQLKNPNKRMDSMKRQQHLGLIKGTVKKF